MAAPDPIELGRKIRQHDNEFEAIYELVGRVDRKVDAVDAKVDAVDRKVDAGFERVDGQMTDVNGKLDAILQRLSG